MKRTLLAAALSMALSASVMAAQTQSIGVTDFGYISSGELIKQSRQIPLSKRATEMAAQQWLQTGAAPDLIGTNGMVMYAYGQSRPLITCAPLHVCVINLLQGEHITSLSIGDSVRWLVQSTSAGDQPVIVVKPTTTGLVTNLVATTDAGRVYYMTLKSDADNYVPQIGFYDPQQLVIDMQKQAEQERAAEQAKAEAKKQAVVASLGSVDPATLDFNFTCKADKGKDDADIMPVRVFAGGGHTYLQMPQSMKYADAPAVFNVSNDDTELLNSRLVHGYYVIDGLPQKFKLVVGVGDKARTVVCQHGKQDSDHGFFWSR